LTIDDDISSLSAILLDEEYYDFLKSGVVVVEGVPVLDAPYMIPFKAKARKNAGQVGPLKPTNAKD
jgi:hypothetical protein